MSDATTRTLQIEVFGKAGCQKCKILNSRLDTLLKKPEWEAFRKVYHDIETEDGMVAFCQSECLNPQRIPALVIREVGEGGSRHLPNPQPGEVDEVCQHSRLYQYLGLQTDYSTTGRGVLTPKMISAILYEAKEIADI